VEKSPFPTFAYFLPLYFRPFLFSLAVLQQVRGVQRRFQKLKNVSQ
jgi:hypothetical protein